MKSFLGCPEYLIVIPFATEPKYATLGCYAYLVLPAAQEFLSARTEGNDTFNPPSLMACRCGVGETIIILSNCRIIGKPNHVNPV